MSDINIDYSNWSNKKAYDIALSVDTDGVKGLSEREISVFQHKASEAGIDDIELKGLLGASFNKRKLPTKPVLNEIANYYTSLSYNKRGTINDRANELGYERMAQLEQDYNKAFEECEAYGLIKLHRDIFEDRIRFNFQEVHDNVDIAMKSLNELKDKLQYAFEKAQGEENHSTPKMTEYDLDKISEKYFGAGMTYEKVIETYDLDFTQSTTINDLMPEQKTLYDKARAYVKEIKTLAREEAQNMRYDSGERMLNETTKYSDSSIELIDFQSYGVNSDGIENMASNIMRQAFIDAIFEVYTPTGIDQVEKKQPQARKYIGDDGKIHIKEQNGLEYNVNGTSFFGKKEAKKL